MDNGVARGDLPQPTPLVDLLQNIGDVAGTVAALGVVVYVLGLAGLAIPFARTEANNLATAWYALSLVPKTVVAGHGARIWFQLPFVSSSVLLLSAWLWQSRPFVQGVAFLVLVFVLGCYVDHKARKASGASRGATYVTYILLGIASLLLGWSAKHLADANDWSAGYLIIFFLGNFLAGLPLPILSEPPLPRVEIRLKETSDKNANCYVGQLVGHTDSFWHLFVENPKRLLSIPDDRVLVVETSEREVVQGSGKSLLSRLLRRKHVPQK